MNTTHMTSTNFPRLNNNCYSDVCRSGSVIFGEDRRFRESSSSWETEHRSRFHSQKSTLTAEDWKRRYKPHLVLARHIQRLQDRKPVCTVKTLLSDPPENKKTETSYYSVAYQHRKPVEPRVFICASNHAKKVDGILPLNVDDRPERLLPVCDVLRVPSQQKYLTRRRRLDSPYQNEGIFYSDAPSTAEEFHRLSTTRIKSSNGDILSRRRYVEPPKALLSVKNFDGGAPATDKPPFYMQFIKSKTII